MASCLLWNKFSNESQIPFSAFIKCNTKKNEFEWSITIHSVWIYLLSISKQLQVVRERSINLRTHRLGRETFRKIYFYDWRVVFKNRFCEKLNIFLPQISSFVLGPLQCEQSYYFLEKTTPSDPQFFQGRIKILSFLEKKQYLFFLENT